MKRFASEFLVVVAGILVAPGLQAWWQDRQDASRSAEYQRQILSDAWLQSYSGWINDPRPVLGNVNALIQTGDIQLVSSPLARRAIISYARIMETTWKDRDAQLARMGPDCHG